MTINEAIEQQEKLAMLIEHSNLLGSLLSAYENVKIDDIVHYTNLLDGDCESALAAYDEEKIGQAFFDAKAEVKSAYDAVMVERKSLPKIPFQTYMAMKAHLAA